MPDMDGARLGARVRQKRSEPDIILYTGYLDAVDAIELKDLRIPLTPARQISLFTPIALCSRISILYRI